MTAHGGAPGTLRQSAEPAQPAGAGVIVEHVAKSYGERVHALLDVSFTIAPGELAWLTGPSGSGKTTLLNLIAGLDVPDRGAIRVDGRSVPDLRDTARYRREVIGFVFQLHHLIPGLTAEENVEIPLMPLRLRRSERRTRAVAALEEVGLARRAAHLPSQLSGGERQRVAVARALVGHPRLLLADEPTGSLDSVATAQVLDLLGELRGRHGMTVLLVTHEPRAALLASRILSIQDGRIVAEGPPEPPR
jgi:putative ABC transport system ATP-binding protein